ncbi:MAG: nicotinate (nicotinamide) nucleotide adenylyltransferase [Deltaproteobacteria bacterium]|nr:MAG: nicotinate (nicotinamide) nucleotide adenylyltransferase [Deltaproteobacteria bacterium]
MRIAIYGGSFNPPHVGHAMVASWVLWTGRADQVWWMPSFSHPFDKALPPFERRLELVESLTRALGGGHRVTAVEAELEPPTYTVDALDWLREEYPEHRFSLVIGADNLPKLDKWKEAERLQASYELVVVGRDGYDNPAGCVIFPGVSSTEVRTRLAAGEPVDHLVPAPILEAVRASYSAAGIGGPKPIQP